MTETTSRPDRPTRNWLREPLLHFLVLAGLLFVAQAIFASDFREEIVVDAATQEFLFDREAQLTLSEPDAAERARIVEDFVNDEILVREATKRGFTDSSRVRALLIQNMRFFITGDIDEPTEEELRAYFEVEAETFQSPPSVDLQHLLFEDPAAVPANLVEQLNAGANPDAFGDIDLSYGRILRFMDTRRLAGAFGRDGAARILALDAADDTWIGPILSPQGSAHFVRVVGRNAPQNPDFDTARDWIATQWLADQARAAVEAELASVRENYRVIIEQPGSE